MTVGDECIRKDVEDLIATRPGLAQRVGLSYSRMARWILERAGAEVIVPVYIYDHSGITVRTYPFHCPWDSGQVGWIYATRDDIMAEFNRKRMSKKLREQVESILLAEVTEYDCYVTGDVYGWVTRAPGGESIESCWGYFGWDYAKHQMLEEARGTIDWYIERQVAEHASRVREWARNEVPLIYRWSLDLGASTGVLCAQT
jgi:hypothetical protein